MNQRMTTNETSFQLQYNLSLVNVVKKLQGEAVLYTLNFSNEVPPVTLSFVQEPGGTYTWDTLPPGNKELAISLGKLIEDHNNNSPEEDEDFTPL